MTRLSEIEARWKKVRPWFWWTSCSFRRLGTKDQQTVLLEAVRYSDGVCGIQGDETTMDAIESAPEDARWLVARVRELEDAARKRIDDGHGEQCDVWASERDDDGNLVSQDSCDCGHTALVRSLLPKAGEG